MSLPATIIIISALLLAATVLVPCVRAEDCATAEAPQEFLANVGEVISNEEMAENLKNYTPPDMVPESEMLYLYFSESWFEKNDEDPQPRTVQLSFPVTWLDKSPINEEEPVVRFRVPKELLESRDDNPDPEIITVSFSGRWFKKFPNLSAAKPVSQAQENDQETDLEHSDEQSLPTIQKDLTLSGLLSLNNQVRAIFIGGTDDTDDWLFESLDPIAFSNLRKDS